MMRVDGWLWIGAIILVTSALDDLSGEDPANEEDQLILTSKKTQSIHKTIDANTDGRASINEMVSYADGLRLQSLIKEVPGIIKYMDSDNSGKIDFDEYHRGTPSAGSKLTLDAAKAREQLERAKFAAADNNGDGVLDASEIPAMFFPVFHDGVLTVLAKSSLRQRDLDNDGVLSFDEFWDGDPVGKRARLETKQEDFATLDVSKDGMIDVQELKVWESGQIFTQRAVMPIIEAADSDGDSHITGFELEKARRKMAQDMRNPNEQQKSRGYANDAHQMLSEWAAQHDEL